MKKLLIFSSAAILFLLLNIAFVTTAPAQESGSIISGSVLAGIQESSLTGIKLGQYYSLRGSFLNLFGELRHDYWGNSSSYVSDNGIVAGADFSLFHIMVAGGIGIGRSSYQAPAYQVSAVLTVTPPVLTYSTFIYEAQAMYQFDIVAGLLTAGVGVNYVAESNTIAPIYGWGGVAMLSLGF
jgi:hypothetical protein